MLVFRVIFHRKSLKELESLTLDLRNRIKQSIEAMKYDPFSGDVRPIKGLRGVYRERVGDYRIFFMVSF